MEKKPTKVGKEQTKIEMKKEDRFAVIRAKLLEMKTRLIQEAKADIGKMIEVGDAASLSDDMDRADLVATTTYRAAEATRRHAQLAKVEAALATLTDGSYGVCEDCGEPIPERRLLLMPFASRCVDCQEAADRMGAILKEPEGVGA